MLSQPSYSQTKSESVPSEQKASREIPKHYIGENVSRKDRTKFLLTTVSIIMCDIIVFYFGGETRYLVQGLTNPIEGAQLKRKQSSIWTSPTQPET